MAAEFIRTSEGNYKHVHLCILKEGQDEPEIGFTYEQKSVSRFRPLSLEGHLSGFHEDLLRSNKDNTLFDDFATHVFRVCKVSIDTMIQEADEAQAYDIKVAGGENPSAVRQFRVIESGGAQEETELEDESPKDALENFIELMNLRSRQMRVLRSDLQEVRKKIRRPNLEKLIAESEKVESAAFSGTSSSPRNNSDSTSTQSQNVQEGAAESSSPSSKGSESSSTQAPPSEASNKLIAGNRAVGTGGLHSRGMVAQRVYDYEALAQGQGSPSVAKAFEQNGIDPFQTHSSVPLEEVRKTLDQEGLEAIEGPDFTAQAEQANKSASVSEGEVGKPHESAKAVDMKAVIGNEGSALAAIVASGGVPGAVRVPNQEQTEKLLQDGAPKTSPGSPQPQPPSTEKPKKPSPRGGGWLSFLKQTVGDVFGVGASLRSEKAKTALPEKIQKKIEATSEQWKGASEEERKASKEKGRACVLAHEFEGVADLLRRAEEELEASEEKLAASGGVSDNKSIAEDSEGIQGGESLSLGEQYFREWVGPDSRTAAAINRSPLKSTFIGGASFQEEPNTRLIADRPNAVDLSNMFEKEPSYGEEALAGASSLTEQFNRVGLLGNSSEDEGSSLALEESMISIELPSEDKQSVALVEERPESPLSIDGPDNESQPVQEKQVQTPRQQALERARGNNDTLVDEPPKETIGTTQNKAATIKNLGLPLPARLPEPPVEQPVVRMVTDWSRGAASVVSQEGIEQKSGKGLPVVAELEPSTAESLEALNQVTTLRFSGEFESFLVSTKGEKAAQVLDGDVQSFDLTAIPGFGEGLEVSSDGPLFSESPRQGENGTSGLQGHPLKRGQSPASRGRESSVNRNSIAGNVKRSVSQEKTAAAQRRVETVQGHLEPKAAKREQQEKVAENVTKAAAPALSVEGKLKVARAQVAERKKLQARLNERFEENRKQVEAQVAESNRRQQSQDQAAKQAVRKSWDDHLGKFSSELEEQSKPENKRKLLFSKLEAFKESAESSWGHSTVGSSRYNFADAVTKLFNPGSKGPYCVSGEEVVAIDKNNKHEAEKQYQVLFRLISLANEENFPQELRDKFKGWDARLNGEKTYSKSASARDALKEYVLKQAKSVKVEQPEKKRGSGRFSLFGGSPKGEGSSSSRWARNLKGILSGPRGKTGGYELFKSPRGDVGQQRRRTDPLTGGSLDAPVNMSVGHGEVAKNVEAGLNFAVGTQQAGPSSGYLLQQEQRALVEEKPLLPLGPAPLMLSGKPVVAEGQAKPPSLVDQAKRAQQLNGEEKQLLAIASTPIPEAGDKDHPLNIPRGYDLQSPEALAEEAARLGSTRIEWI